MKTSRLLLAAIPVGVLALGAVALGKWSFRNVFGPSSTARAEERTGASAGSSAGDRVTPIPGSAEEIAEVAETMAEEGGAVLLTEVAPIGEGEVLVAETLLVAEPNPRHG